MDKNRPEQEAISKEGDTSRGEPWWGFRGVVKNPARVPVINQQPKLDARIAGYPFVCLSTRSLFMYFDFEGSLTLTFKVGKAVFPVEKQYLFREVELFWNDRALLDSDEYEVRTPVSPEVFQAFLDYLQGNTHVISEENCDSFWFLAEEFEMDAISEKCDLMMESRRRVSRKAKLPKWARVHREIEVETGRRVILKKESGSETYSDFRNLREIEGFTSRLRHVKEEEIEIEGIERRDRLMEKAVATIYTNTVKAFPESRIKKPFLAMTLWALQKGLSDSSIDAEIYCLNRLNEIAPSAFEKARLLLLSQCKPLCPDEFIPLPNANRCMIGDAIRMLRYEKNGKRSDADALLALLKATGRYETFLEEIPSD
jgi:hypothetical protein